MKLFFSSLFLASIMLILSSCSGSQETTEEDTEQEQEIYIFDDVTEDSTETDVAVEIEPVTVDTVESIISLPDKHIVQVGAYTTEERAQRFVLLNQQKISWRMKISYSTKVELWVVQLPPFKSRNEAEEIRNELWKMPTFQDAFIVPVE